MHPGQHVDGIVVIDRVLAVFVNNTGNARAVALDDDLRCIGMDALD